MKREIVLFGIVLMLIISIVPFSVSTNKISSKKDVLFASNSSIVHRIVVDPEINQNSNEPQLLLLLFKDFESAKSFVATANEYGIEVIEEFWIAPIILVRSIPKKVISLASIFAGVRGIYSNRVFPMPKFFTSNKGITPTTRESAKSIGADYVWEQGYDGSGVKICIIDTGIYKDHPDLKKGGVTKVIAEKSFVLTRYGYSEDDKDPTDGRGHGTAVAGVAAGTGEGDPEIGTGVAPGASLLNAKVFASTGEEGATLAAIVAAIQWAVSQGADVINMSLGGSTWYIDPLYVAVKRATELGVIVVVAAGNEGEDIGSMSVGSPGDIEYAITVGATNVGGTAVKSYSSYGPNVRFSVKPDIVAPSGIDVIWIPPAEYVSGAEGTSFSSPHVAGAAALLVQYLESRGYGGITRVGAIKAALMNAAKRVGSYGELLVGAGYVQVDDAFDLLKNLIEGGSLKIASVLPTKVPCGMTSARVFFPYREKIFRGMKLEFNVSITISYSTTISVSLDSELQNVFEPHFISSFNVTPGTYIWEFNVTVKPDAPKGSHQGTLTFTDSDGNVIGTVDFSFTVEDAVAFLAFDMKHTAWVSYPADFRWGQYNEFALLLEELNVAIEHIYFGHAYNLEVLNRYDIIFAPDTASYYEIYDLQHGDYLGVEGALYSSEEIADLVKWVKNGGVLIFIAMTPGTARGDNDPTNINAVVRNFGFEFTEVIYNETDPAPVPVIQNHILTKFVSTLPFYGCGIRVLSDDVLVLAKYEDTPVIVARFYLGSEKTGLVLGLGTNFIFDNWAMRGRYPAVSYLSTNNFTKNIVDFAVMRKNLRLILPDEILGEVYNFHFYTPLAINLTIIKDSEGTLSLLPKLVEDYHYIIRYAPRVKGNQRFIAELYEAVSIEGEFHYYYLTLARDFKANGVYSDTAPPEITVKEVLPKSPNEFQRITIVINVSDDTWPESVIVKYKGASISAEYNITDGLWYAYLPSAGIGSFSISIKIVATDAFGNTGELTYTINLNAVYTMSVIGVVAVIIIVGVLIMIKKRAS